MCTGLKFLLSPQMLLYHYPFLFSLFCNVINQEISWLITILWINIKLTTSPQLYMTSPQLNTTSPQLNTTWPSVNIDDLQPVQKKSHRDLVSNEILIFHLWKSFSINLNLWKCLKTVTKLNQHSLLHCCLPRAYRRADHKVTRLAS